MCLALVGGLTARGQAGAEPSSAPFPPPPPPAASAASTASAPGEVFAPLDLPPWVILDPRAEASERPWILVVDDPQCPYCMQLHLALEKSRALGDPEIARAVLARLPFPLAYHDQSAHIVSDAFCLEASGPQRWSAASYLEWLIVDPWKAEPEWANANLEDLEKDGGFFDAKYAAHKVTSSRRREFQTERARAEAACQPDPAAAAAGSRTGKSASPGDPAASRGAGAAGAAGAAGPAAAHFRDCAADPDCEKLCMARATCLEACPAAQGERGPAGGPAQAATTTASGAEESKDGPRAQCLSACSERFVSARYRQFSKVHSECLLAEGAGSAHGKTAAAFAWAIAHKVPGTPTVYVGHPSVGFRTLGDSDHLADFLVLLRRALGQTRTAMAAAGNTTGKTH